MFQLFSQILDWVCGFFTMALLARFLMQWTRAPFRNPVGEFVITLTDWVVRPTRRLIPSSYGLDLASLLLAWLTQAIFQSMFYVLGGWPGLAISGVVALLALIEVLRVGVYLLMGVVIVSALLSWVNPYAPLAPVLNIIARPFLRPLQNLIPLIGGVDLSPMVLLLIFQVLLRLLDSAYPLIFR